MAEKEKHKQQSIFVFCVKIHELLLRNSAIRVII